MSREDEPKSPSREETRSTKNPEERDKRDRQSLKDSSQQAGESSGVNDKNRPLKTRKIDKEEDAVVMARRALEMFRNEVGEDGDYEEPDTAPVSSTKSQKPSSKETPPSNGEETGHSRWKKPARQPMVFAQDDDPSIL